MGNSKPGRRLRSGKIRETRHVSKRGRARVRRSSVAPSQNMVAKKVERGTKGTRVMTRNVWRTRYVILDALARQYGRYGYRKIAGLLEQAGWLVNDKRVERIWRREGLKVPHKQPKRVPG